MKKQLILPFILLSLNAKAFTNPNKDSLIFTECLIYNKSKTKIWINIDLEIGKIYYDIWTTLKHNKVTVYRIKQKDFNRIKS